MSHDHAIETALGALQDKPAWGLSRTHGSMFFLELGESVPKAGQKHVHGEFHFLIEMCHWRIEDEEAVLVGSDDSQEKIDSVFQALSLSKLGLARSILPSQSLELVFSSGVRLKMFTASADAKDEWIQWRLFCPDGNVVVVDGGGRISLSRGDEPALA